MTRKEYDKMVDDAIGIAKQNLSGDDLKKSIEALNNWRKNYTYVMRVASSDE